MTKLSVSIDELVIRKPLPWALYDDKGELVLDEGAFIASEKHAKRIISRGVFRHDEAGSKEPAKKAEKEVPKESSPTPAVIKSDQPKVNIFTELEALEGELQKGFYYIINCRPCWQAQINFILERINLMVEQSPDAVLGAVHLYKSKDLALIQPLFSVVLVTLVSKTLQFSDDRLKAAQTAALCANISCLGYTKTLNNQKQRLSKKQFTVLQGHPEHSMLLLKQAGCTDKLTLDAVIQHHERNDGTGYPNKLPGEKILDIAKLIAIADTYLAMTGKRCYKESYVAKDALKEVYASGVSCDQIVYLSFIKELGIFPPGTFVRLKNGEIAAVVHRGEEDSMSPTIKAVVNAKGVAYKTPFTRDCQNPQYSIKETCPMETDLLVPLDVLFDFKPA